MWQEALFLHVAKLSQFLFGLYSRVVGAFIRNAIGKSNFKMTSFSILSFNGVIGGSNYVYIYIRSD